MNFGALLIFFRDFYLFAPANWPCSKKIIDKTERHGILMAGEKT
jgi:hypothetical protein